MSDVRIGISGWTYAPWRGVFYPPKLRIKEELAFASRRVASIEINGTFYSLQRPSSYAAWRDAAPADFVFALKGPRFITHIKRLREFERPMANFLASGPLRLRGKLGPMLWQLPPNFHFDPERIEPFLAALPRDTRTAARLAKGHDDKLKTEPWLRIDRNRPLRHAMEVRHESFVSPRFVDLLRKHDVALVVADTAGKWPLMFDVTSDFVYIRLHGDVELYVSGYTAPALRTWAERIAAWRDRGLDVYCYFDNDVKVRAPYDAMRLMHRLGLGPRPAPLPPLPGSPEDYAIRTDWPGFGAPGAP